jgi:predicted nucleotidyltransferase
MRYGLTDRECRMMSGIFSKSPKVKEVSILGCRALGNYKAASDIDLSVKGESLILYAL